MKFRHEFKHQINQADLLQLKTRLSAIMDHDKHSGPDGTYEIKSLYFDNYRDKALKEKLHGISRREKFRIRYYNTDTSYINLEKKTKINGMCNKEKAPLTAAECQRLIDGDYHFLLESKHDLLKELYAKMQYQVLRPVCIVTYRRESFVYGPGNVRVTLDTELRGSYNIKEFLNPEQQYLRLYHTSILEVKWDEYLPQIVRDAVQMNGRKSAAFSKYAAVRI